MHLHGYRGARFHLPEKLTESCFKFPYARVHVVTQISNCGHNGTRMRAFGEPGKKEIAQIGAIIGRGFSYELIATVAPHAATDLHNALNQLTQSGLAFRRGAPPEALYIFKHALVQDVAYDSLLKVKRVQIHAQIARALEERFPGTIAAQPETIAHHYTAAEMHQESIPYWRRAGELAHQRMALQESIAHLEHGIGLVERVESPAIRGRLELDLRAVLVTVWMALRGWAYSEVERNLARASELEGKFGCGVYSLRIHWGFWLHRLCSGRNRESLTLAEELLAQANQRGDASADVGRRSARTGATA